ncbi:L-aspartate oxidase [Stratiformator vulcanicus]|uniref:L-aspartate oxidase n=1 Tax=Stratiformator vulcanicus TaxID=2527980 RepID=A0A517QYQ9_9PLAN|nr:L-aspartate oxidase [Stratiformator vulcanicus]QDT36772.1 L-aspartate oxidase [Stratiformator vulcanicus]
MTALTLPVRRRYLVQFNPKRVPHMFTDVLILGGGIAGMRAALSIDTKLETVVVTKDAVTESNSSYAQGGIAGVLDPLDEIANHAADTIAAGKGMCDPDVVESVVAEAAERIRELISYGAHFDEINGELALTREGGHSHRRIAHALGDATGWEVMRAVRDAVIQRETIQTWEQTFLLDLLSWDGRCCGALVWNPQHGKTFVWAKSTILCTGGAGRLYRESTNPDIATADGHAAAFRAGAEVRDMELMQFHPTVLYIAGSSRHLISEAVRGEGAFLRNVRGERFMPEYSPQLELAPRDEVSRAITSEMARTNHPCVYLDLTHLDRDLIAERFPNIGKVCREFGLDIASDLIPVRPGAHYMIGGVTVDELGASSLPGLWAAGEVASTGLHGANRLASNSLLEGLVYGRRCGAAASEHALATPDRFSMPPLVAEWPASDDQDDEDIDLDDVRNSLMSLMWRHVGISRNAEGLEDARVQVDFWDRYISSREFQKPRGWELQNMLLVARLMIASAMARQESRGVHFRSDFPEPREDQLDHVSLLAAT